MLRWARLPAAVFVLVFAGSLVNFMLDDDGGSEPSQASARGEPKGRLAVTYSVSAQNPDQGFLGSVALDGSDLQNVIEPPGGDRLANNGSPSVDPNGDAVVFQRAAGGPEGGLPPYIYVIPLDGSQPERRLTRGHTPEIDPDWSPNGERIAFARQVGRRFDLFACAADGSDVVQLTDTPGVDETTPAWTPDGSEIAFARSEDGVEKSPAGLWVMSAGGARERRVRGDDGHDYSAPAWAPDGKRLALLMDGHVAVTDAQGSAVRQLTADEESKETRPSWSPDGARIAFTRDPGTLRTIRPDGSDEVKVPFEAAANGVAWMPAP